MYFRVMKNKVLSVYLFPFYNFWRCLFLYTDPHFCMIPYSFSLKNFSISACDSYWLTVSSLGLFFYEVFISCELLKDILAGYRIVDLWYISSAGKVLFYFLAYVSLKRMLQWTPSLCPSVQRVFFFLLLSRFSFFTPLAFCSFTMI